MKLFARMCAAVMLLTVLVSCGGDDSGGDAQAVSITAEDYSFGGAPAEFEGGLLQLSLENRGQVAHEAALISIGDTSVEQFIEDFGPVIEGGPFPDYLEEITGIGEVDPGETATSTVTVTEGNYVWVCTLDGDAEGTPEEGEEEASGDPHYAQGMIQPVTVSGGDDDPELPDADSSITSRDHEFDVDVQAGAQTVNFTNDGPDQVHHAVLVGFVEGTDEAAAEAALAEFVGGGEEAPPPAAIDLESFETLNSSSVFSSGQGGTFELTLEADRTYAVICFIQDREGGPPHLIANDMKEIFTVE